MALGAATVNENSIFVLNTHGPFRGTTMNENSNLYLMLLCQLGQLSQWPVFNRPTQRTQRTQRAQPVIFVLKDIGSVRKKYQPKTRL